MPRKAYKPLSRRHKLTRLPKGFKSPRRAGGSHAVGTRALNKSLNLCGARRAGSGGVKQPLKLPALGSIAKRVKALRFKPTFLRVAYIEIKRFDWEKHDQVVCLRLLPTMKPDWFKHRVRVLA